MKLIYNCIALAFFTSLLLTTVTDSFSSHHQMTIGFLSHYHHPSATTAPLCQLMMTSRPLAQSQSQSQSKSQLQQSRRDILLATFSSTATVAAAAAALATLVMAPTAVEAAPAKAPPVVTYEGFCVDPKSP